MWWNLPKYWFLEEESNKTSEFKIKCINTHMRLLDLLEIVFGKNSNDNNKLVIFITSHTCLSWKKNNNIMCIFYDFFKSKIFSDYIKNIELLIVWVIQSIFMPNALKHYWNYWISSIHQQNLSNFVVFKLIRILYYSSIFNFLTIKKFI